MLLVWLSGCAATPAPAPAPPAPPTSAQAGATTIVAVAPPAQPCCPKPTMWDFLGVKGLFKFTGGAIERIRSRLGMRFPGLEAKPPVLSITDPANMSADSPPAVKAAAEAKANEDAAPQKIKALRYLSRLGCTDCYPDVEPALIHAMEDCTESVRYEAVVTVRKLCAGPCNVCQSGQCCSADVVKKLDELANKRDERGCYVEPSPRVRRVARLALDCCPAAPSAVPSGAPALPTEGPSGELPPPPGELPPPTPAPAAAAAARAHPAPATFSRLVGESSTAARPEIAAVDYEAFAPSGRAASSRVWAEVNGEPIFEQEIRARIERQRAAAIGSDGTEPDELSLLRSELERAVNRKLLYQAAQRAGRDVIPAAAHWDPAGAPATSHDPIAAQVAHEHRVAEAWLAETVRVDEHVAREELFQRYRMQMERFQQPEMVRWEHSYADFRRLGGEAAAQEALEALRAAALGLPHQPSSALALIEAHAYEWTRREDVPSPLLAQWLFSLPPGKLSPVIRDQHGLHLLRMLERRPARVIPFEEAAVELHQEVVGQRRAEAERTYVRYLRGEAQVWTVLDGPAAQTAGAAHP